MAMSNMNTNRYNAKAKEKHSTKNREVNQSGKRFYQGEFGSEFDFDALAQTNNFPEAPGKVDSKQPVSERTAWH